MQNKDTRWLQRFSNFNKAFIQLKKFIDKNTLNELERQGLIKAFEYTYELGWNLLKDYFEYQGNDNINGSRDAISEAFKQGLIKDGNGWMNMFKDRNQTSHSYNEVTATEIADNILNNYFKLFAALQEQMKGLMDNSQIDFF